VIELVVREMVRYPDPTERFRGEHLRDQASTGEVMGALGEVEVDLEDLTERPPARRRDALTVRLPVLLLG